ncbi:MAG: diphthine--ammonia ligase [Nanoarchaeota archaeon]
MKLAALFSGGKDSVLALHEAAEQHDIVCLITMVSKNPESYMFHTPNIHLTALQAASLEIPQITFETAGEKEEELEDLKKAIVKAREQYQIGGIITGAIQSVYQASRIQKICNDLDLKCINPLWQRNQIDILRELLDKKMKVIIVGVFAYPLEKEWLGKEMDEKVIEDLTALQKSLKINPAGEGGEIETLVVDAPLFKRPIKIIKAEPVWDKDSGIYKIIEAI